MTEPSATQSKDSTSLAQIVALLREAGREHRALGERVKREPPVVPLWMLEEA